jgi:hypothetical protein
LYRDLDDSASRGDASVSARLRDARDFDHADFRGPATFLASEGRTMTTRR